MNQFLPFSKLCPLCANAYFIYIKSKTLEIIPSKVLLKLITGIEQVNLILTKDALYLLSYISGLYFLLSRLLFPLIYQGRSRFTCFFLYYYFVLFTLLYSASIRAEKPFQGFLLFLPFITCISAQIIIYYKQTYMSRG